MLQYNPNLKEKARRLRKNMTDSERILWSRLRARQLLGVQFYRQKPIGNYIVDFYAPRANLVVEVDGSQHQDNRMCERDHDRDGFLNGLGLQVVRFNSREVLKETDSVVEVIHRVMAHVLKEKSPSIPL
jgi:very-short-patch-repair endonuclease